jgi:SAM-dependent methyltransferase
VTAAAGSGRGQAGDHYSYRHYADPAVASRFDARRFGGPIGQYLLASQAALIETALAPVAGRHVIDVGTGTGRAAIGLSAAGATVVGVDASSEMLDVARHRAAEAGASIDFRLGDAHALEFPDASFDAAVGLRLIMHTPDWRRCLAELCRVARWRIVVDFPALGSAATIESLLRRVGRSAGLRTEAYRVLGAREVEAVLASRGFHVVTVHRQFVLPIALHRAIGRPGFTRTVERGLASLGLLRLVGSPVTMVAER